MMICLALGSQANYFEDTGRNIFGISKKDTRKPASDFRFEIVGEMKSSYKGYVLEVFPEVVDYQNSGQTESKSR